MSSYSSAPSLCKLLSKRGNPTLTTLQEILKPLGLRLSVALDKVAKTFSETFSNGVVNGFVPKGRE